MGGNSRRLQNGLAAEGIAAERHRRHGAERGGDDGVGQGDQDAVEAGLQQPVVLRQRLEPDQVELEGQAVERRVVEGKQRHHQDRQIEEDQHQHEIEADAGIEPSVSELMRHDLPLACAGSDRGRRR